MISHLAACTATALIAVLAAFLCARRSARWRHAILLAAMLRFAVPTGWLTSAGAELVRFAPATPTPDIADDLSAILLARRGAIIVRSAVTPWKPNLPFFWTAGFAICAALWTCRWSRRPATVRPANPAEIAAFHRAMQQLPGRTIVNLAIVDPEFTPAVRGLGRACILLPEDLSADLSLAELETVMAHEIAHVRRHDNLLALLTHVIVAAFWFHPLVWWMERRMLLERETACDEMVLAGGVAADVYAAGILRVCRRSLNLSGVYAAFTGPNLIQRMEHIMSADVRSSRSLISRAALCGLIALTLLAPVGTGFLAAEPRPIPQAAPQPLDMRDIMSQVEKLLKQNQADEAIALLQREIGRNPKRMDVEVALGNAAVRAQRYDLAIATFEKVLGGLTQDSKSVPDLYLRLGETYRRKGDLNLAIDNLLRAKELVPGNVIIRITLAITLDGAGKAEAAQNEYEAVLALDPENYAALNNLAFLLAHENGDLDRALGLVQRALSLKPGDTNVVDTLGWIQLKRNLADSAILAFGQAIEAEPSNPVFHYHLGMAFSQKGALADATRELQTALTFNPSPTDRDSIRQLLDRLQR